MRESVSERNSRPTGQHGRKSNEDLEQGRKDFRENLVSVFVNNLNPIVDSVGLWDDGTTGRGSLDKGRILVLAHFEFQAGREVQVGKKSFPVRVLESPAPVSIPWVIEHLGLKTEPHCVDSEVEMSDRSMKGLAQKRKEKGSYTLQSRKQDVKTTEVGEIKDVLDKGNDITKPVSNAMGHVEAAMERGS
ncbi:hypothetical protein Q3G72_032541 [Acer saccharum]|nr:hypothetical protein Q3G72_032541 [Acer saccharum]